MPDLVSHILLLPCYACLCCPSNVCSKFVFGVGFGYGFSVLMSFLMLFMSRICRFCSCNSVVVSCIEHYSRVGLQPYLTRRPQPCVMINAAVICFADPDHYSWYCYRLRWTLTINHVVVVLWLGWFSVAVVLCIVVILCCCLFRLLLLLLQLITADILTTAMIIISITRTTMMQISIIRIAVGIVWMSSITAWWSHHHQTSSYVSC